MNVPPTPRLKAKEVIHFVIDSTINDDPMKTLEKLSQSVDINFKSMNPRIFFEYDELFKQQNQQTFGKEQIITICQTGAYREYEKDNKLREFALDVLNKLIMGIDMDQSETLRVLKERLTLRSKEGQEQLSPGIMRSQSWLGIHPTRNVNDLNTQVCFHIIESTMQQDSNEIMDRVLRQNPKIISVYPYISDIDESNNQTHLLLQNYIITYNDNIKKGIYQRETARQSEAKTQAAAAQAAAAQAAATAQAAAQSAPSFWTRVTSRLSDIPRPSIPSIPSFMVPRFMVRRDPNDRATSPLRGGKSKRVKCVKRSKRVKRSSTKRRKH